ncbi:HDOD domain-containing protein [Allohahella marinimesophila]|uniref:HDOD domain-containing protein n=1 Tax=Allohahella marinimesophila TaxID=1054972 RepID=UPI0031CDEB22
MEHPELESDDEALMAAELAQTVASMLERPLPAVTHSGRLLHLALKEKELSFAQMAAHVQNDPVLALTLIRNANLFMRSKEAAIRNIPQAISIIGLERLSVLLQTTGSYDFSGDPGHQSTARLEAALGRSLCAAEMARFTYTTAGKPEEEIRNAFWNTLLWASPYWYLWHWRGEEMQAVYSQTRIKSMARSDARKLERSILGFEIRAFWREAHKQMALPILDANTLFDHELADLRSLAQLTSAAKKGYENDSPRAFITKPLRQFSKRPGFTETMLNHLVENASISWHSKAVNRCFFAMAARWKASPIQGVRWAHEVAVLSARQHPLRHGVGLATSLLNPAPGSGEPLFDMPEAGPGLISPQPAASQRPPLPTEKPLPPAAPDPIDGPSEIAAERTVTPEQPDEASRPSTEEKALRSPVAPPLASKLEQPRQAAPRPVDDSPLKAYGNPGNSPQPQLRKAPNRALFNRTIEDMLINPMQFQGLPDLMQTTISCVVDGIGLEACLVSLMTPDRAAIKAFFTTPLPARETLEGRQLHLEEFPLFSKLMRKPASIWVSPESSPRIKAHLSEEFASLFQVEEFFASSCFVGTRPVGLIYADNGFHSGPMTTFEYESFKELCNATSQVVYNLAQRARSDKKK